MIVPAALLNAGPAGVTMGSEVDAIAYLASRYFGTARYGLVFAILISVYGFGIGLASWLVAMAYDANGNYNSVLVVLLVGVGVAMISMLSMPRPPELEAEHA